MTPGKFHRPKPAPGPTGFETLRAPGGSTILADNPKMLHYKRGPAKPNQPFEANYNRVTTYSQAKASKAGAA